MFDFFTFASLVSWSDCELESAEVWCVMHLVLSVRCEAREGLTVDVTVLWWSGSYTLAGEFLQHEKVRLQFGRTADEMGSHR